MFNLIKFKSDKRKTLPGRQSCHDRTHVHPHSLHGAPPYLTLSSSASRSLLTATLISNGTPLSVASFASRSRSPCVFVILTEPPLTACQSVSQRKHARSSPLHTRTNTTEIKCNRPNTSRFPVWARSRDFNFALMFPIDDCDWSGTRESAFLLICRPSITTACVRRLDIVFRCTLAVPNNSISIVGPRGANKG